jgi:hypothetical protein
MTTPSPDPRRAADALQRAAEEAEAQLAALQTRRRRREARPEDYVYDKAQEAYWDLLDHTLHSEKAVDASIPLELWRVEVEVTPRGRRRERMIPPSRDIARVENDQFVEGSTWWPGRPRIVEDWFIDSHGAFPAIGRRSFNQFRPPPTFAEGSAEAADPWVEHVRRLWPRVEEHEYFFDFCAHMLQRPHEKCGAAVVLAGTQGIGKDAALVPVKGAIGVWNAREINPDDLFSTYNPWVQTLMLTINEVKASKDELHASSMYGILKPLIAAPPDVLPLNDKYAKLRYVVNVLRVFMTTNEPAALFIPEEDRRMFVLHSFLPRQWHLAEGDPGYFERLFGWFAAGGIGHVAAWLRARDLRAFNPKAPPPRTAGWDAVASSWETPDDAFTRALERMGHPPVFFGQELLDGAGLDDRDEVAGALKSPRKIAHRMQRDNYLLRRRADGGDRWVFRAADGSRVFRSRLAFVRSEFAADPAQVDRMIEERGAEVAARMAPTAAAGPRRADAA